MLRLVLLCPFYPMMSFTIPIITKIIVNSKNIGVINALPLQHNKFHQAQFCNGLKYQTKIPAIIKTRPIILPTLNTFCFLLAIF